MLLRQSRSPRMKFLDNCKVRIFCIYSSHHETLSSDVPIRCFTPAFYHLWNTSLVGDFDLEELQVADTSLKTTKLGVLETTNHVAATNIDVWCAATDILVKDLKEEKLSQLLATVIAKIKERSPHKNHFTRKLVSLDPRIIVSEPENATKKIQQVLMRLIEDRWKTLDQGDSILAQYRKFISEAKKYHQERLPSSLEKKDWIVLSVNCCTPRSNINTCGKHWNSSLFVSWLGCSRKRISSQQRSSCSKF